MRGGTPEYQFSLAPGSRLPPGLDLKPADTISGSASEPGRYEFALHVRDASGQQAQQRYVLRVLAPAKPAAAPTAAAAQPAPIASAPMLGSVTPQSAAAARQC